MDGIGTWRVRQDDLQVGMSIIQPILKASQASKVNVWTSIHTE